MLVLRKSSKWGGEDEYSFGYNIALSNVSDDFFGFKVEMSIKYTGRNVVLDLRARIRELGVI